MKDKTKVLKTYRILSFSWGIERKLTWGTRRPQVSLRLQH